MFFGGDLGGGGVGFRLLGLRAFVDFGVEGLGLRGEEGRGEGGANADFVRSGTPHNIEDGLKP